MLRRNFEYFRKKRLYEKLGISEIKQLEKKLFFLFPTVCILDFCTNMSPRLYILFLVDKSMTGGNNEHMF